MPPKKQDDSKPTAKESLESVTNAASASSTTASLGGRTPQPVEQQLWREDEGKSLKVQSFYAPKSQANTRSDLTMAEVAKHDKRTDAWIVVDGHCYDVTAYVDVHPGGWLPIVNLAGKDVTDAFANYHPARVYRMLLPQFYIGEVADYEVSDFVKEHRALRQQLLERNLFETSPWYYYKLVVFLAFLFSASMYITFALEQRVLGAVVLGLFWQQLAFVGHDVGHNALSHNRKADQFWGTLFGNFTGGISLAWWKRSHNVHHIVTNSVENDPDIQHVPFFAVTEKIFKPYWSTYHNKEFRMDNVFARFVIGHQHLLFYPVMAFARWNLYIQSWKLLLSSEPIQLRKLEILSLLGFAGWLSALCLSFPTRWDSLVFLMVSHIVAGVLHVQITLSHFYMDTYHGRAYNDDSDEWFRMQLKTTMNVDCPEWMDWFHGGLQFQIEHHLWPRLPRHNLREARKLVKPFCEKHGVIYKEPGFVRGNIEMLASLRRVAANCQNDETFNAASHLWDTPIWNGLYARG